MPSFADSALRLLRQFVGSPARNLGPYAGTTTVLDGSTAVAITEAAISEAAALGGSQPADGADLTWRAEQLRRTGKPDTDTLLSHSADGPRGTLAAAIGLSLSGIRATSFLSSADLAGAQDVLISAAGRHVPLVVHLSNRALASHASASGSGHEALHLSADSGCFILFAANVQEAVDFTLIARRVAEHTLIPGLVVMDGEQTALALQDVRLPGQELLQKYLGDADDVVAPSTQAQRQLFGEQRRRVPRWFDLDRPVMLGGKQPAAGWGLGKAADQVFLEQALDAQLERSMTLFAEHTGRHHQPYSAYRLDNADTVMVAQGAAIETAEAVADHLRTAHKLKVGVLGLRCLRPLAADRIAELLGHMQSILVLERMNAPTAGPPPLMRELQAALSRGRQKDIPHTRSVVYGLGGLPLRGADLIELCTGAERIKRTPVYLGIRFLPAESPYPKRQVLLDRLRREYPGIAELGLSSSSDTPDLRPAEALTLAIHRVSGQGGEGLTSEVASFLQRVSENQLRSHPAIALEPWGACCVDRFTCASQDLRDPGQQMPVDLSLLTADAATTGADPLTDLRQDGILLLEDTGPGTELPVELAASLRRRQAMLYRIAAFGMTADEPGTSGPEHREYLLGAVFGAMLDAGLLDLKPRRLLGAREQLLQHLPEAQRTVRLNSFQSGLERVHRLDAAGLRAAPPTAHGDDEAPLQVRKLGSIEQTYDSLPRFWDQLGVLYRNGDADQLAPDPYMATGTIPPLSSSFQDLSRLRRTLPVLDPALCNACGDCWRQCPDGAVGALALTPTALLDAAIGRAGADAVRPLAGKLAARILSQCSNPDVETANLGELLGQAALWLQDKMSLPAERRARLSPAIEKLQQALAGLPVVASDPFLAQTPEENEHPAELLFLAINPNACKGCGICINACEPQALTTAAQSSKVLIEARNVWRAWEQLPDTSSATLNRVGKDPRLGAQAAALLSRRHTDTLTGGDAAEPGSGERLALRLAMAAAESGQRAAIDAFVGKVQNTGQEISGLIREILADALPTDDLEALATGLEKVETRQAELGRILNPGHNAIDSGIDIHRLRRLVHLAKDLEQLAWRLTQGPQGRGRSRLGVVLAGGSVAEWAGMFPNNPFGTPVALADDAVQLGAGLLEGQLRQVTDGFRLIRRARLELERATDAVREGADLGHLGWRDLTPEERALCPPLLVVGSGDLLRGGGLSQIDSLLGSDLPIKLLLLNELDLGLATQAALDTAVSTCDDPAINLALLALARRNACVAQTSIGASDHMMRCLHTTIGYRGPALLHLHAPSPLRHGFAPAMTVQRASQAVASRVLPLFLYDPQADGVFGSRLSLEGNPQPLAPWAGDSAEHSPTPASWALGERRFRGHFSKLPADSPDALAVSDYLALDDAQRSGRTPFVQGKEADGSVARFAVDRDLLAVCAERLQAWRVLQELAGLVTPFTAQVERTARDQVAAAHAAELAALRADYEARIAALQGEMLEKTRSEMRRRMMQLAGYTATDKAKQGGESA